MLLHEVWPLEEARERALLTTELDPEPEVPKTAKNKETLRGHYAQDYRKKQSGSDGRIQDPKQILNWQPESRRMPGRPRKSWREGVDAELRERGLVDDLRDR